MPGGLHDAGTPRQRTSWRCSICNINYPPTLPEGTPCAVCDGKMDPMYETAPHQDWERRVKDLLELIESRSEMDNGMPNATAKIRKQRRSKTYWVKKSDLLAAGYLNIVSLQIVRINGKYYEIQGFDSTKQEYWVEEIEESLNEEELYSQLD